jgi:hypothetical protein
MFTLRPYLRSIQLSTAPCATHLPLQVLDDTLRENQGGIGAGMSDPRGAAAAAALRQSREAMSELWSKAGDGGGNGRALGSLADEPEELPRGCGMKDQHNYGLAAYRS